MCVRSASTGLCGGQRVTAVPTATGGLSIRLPPMYAPATTAEIRQHRLWLCRYVKPGPGLYRPSEANLPRGDAGKTRRPLGWTNRTGFEELVRELVDEDCRAPGIERAKA